jgi:acetyl-CoA synthase
MSKIIASAGIRGAYSFVAQAEAKYKFALEKWGENAEVAFPNTGYYLPVIYGMMGHPVKKVKDIGIVLERCKSLLPPIPKAEFHLPYLGPALDAGMATLFAQELIEAVRYMEHPDYYLGGAETITPENIWLGAADDIILRKRGVEFVDGTAPGFAAILGAAPSAEIAKKIAQQLQERSLYVFMAGSTDGKCFSEQLVEAGVEVGWNTRLVSYGRETSAAVFAFGFATRAAMSFGGLQPGDYRKILIYNKDRIFAFALTFGYVAEEWYATGLGAVNYGFPVIADSEIPQILPTGVCTYEHVVSGIGPDEMVQRATEVRGLKVKVAKVPIPISYGPAFEGERVRGDDIFLEMGGGRTAAVEWTTSAAMDAIEDGKVTLFGPDVTDVPAKSKLPLAIKVKVAGRGFQQDFEPILERQIHHLINYAQGLMHIGQRDICWLRISKQAVEKGFTLKDLGKILHAKYHEDFGGVLDKVEVELYTIDEKVKEVLADARASYKLRDERVEGMKDETTEPFYSCTLCQSFAPSHVCVITPERTGLCGAYSWLDCKASNEINPTGPNQPIPKGTVLDPVNGQWTGVNEFVRKASRGAVEFYSAYSILNQPMTSCGCFEAIAAVLPMCNGIMTVDRDFTGMTPSGMKFTTLAGTVGGGQVVPGFVGHSKYFITSRKFVAAEGGVKRLVWMPKRLKEEVRERFSRVAAEVGIPDLLDRIADETVGTTEEEILGFLTEKQHPALEMPSLF